MRHAHRLHRQIDPKATQRLRLSHNLNDAIYKYFGEAGRALMRTDDPAEIAAIKAKARTSIMSIINVSRNVCSKEDVTSALAGMHLLEFDT